MGLIKILKMIGGYTFRWIGYPTNPRLIEIGKPNRNSPVLVTCNFVLTVKRVMRDLKGVDCYLLIAPSKGINVWCGACGGDFNTDSVISIIKTSKIGEKVDHRILILPQLSAPGMDIIRLKKELGWEAKFGPVESKDIPDYIKNHFTKAETMRSISFPLKARFDMGNIYFYSLILIFSICFGIAAIFLSDLNIWLYLDSIFLIFFIIYGSMIVLPSINLKNTKLKVALFELLTLCLILLFYALIYSNFFYLTWNTAISLVVSLIIIEDFNGLTPTNKSEMGEKTWNKGEDKMNFGGFSFQLQPYGLIHLKRENCIGCKLCIEVCPQNLYNFDENDKKVNLNQPEKCINCNACVKRCPVQCIEILGRD